MSVMPICYDLFSTIANIFQSLYLHSPILNHPHIDLKLADSMSDAYAFASKSSLKLKSAPGVEVPGVKKKKKKKSKNKEKDMEKALRALSGESSSREAAEEEDEEDAAPEADPQGKDLFRGKTPVEVAWLKKKREKEMDKIKKKAELNHMQKVMKFNEGLNKLSEHYDIPKVSWTK